MNAEMSPRATIGNRPAFSKLTSLVKNAGRDSLVRRIEAPHIAPSFDSRTQASLA